MLPNLQSLPLLCVRRVNGSDPSTVGSALRS